MRLWPSENGPYARQSAPLHQQDGRPRCSGSSEVTNIWETRETSSENSSGPSSQLLGDCSQEDQRLKSPAQRAASFKRMFLNVKQGGNVFNLLHQHFKKHTSGWHTYFPTPNTTLKASQKQEDRNFQKLKTWIQEPRFWYSIIICHEKTRNNPRAHTGK